MAQKSGFFGSVNHDRAYGSADIAAFLSNFFTNGIFNNSLEVSSNNNMTVNVASGNANINGYSYTNTDALTLNIADADSELGRIDSVILRLNLSDRQITAMILQGSYATTPGQPSIVRSGNIYDLRLANISVPAGSTRITSSMITDTRFGTECGNVTQAVLSLDTSEIFAQYQAYFEEWFANLQDQLDDNQAGHLQNEIGNLANLDTDDKSNLVNAINENNSNNGSLFVALGLNQDTYSSSSTYAVGDLVIHNYAIYECTTAITTAEAWNSAHWALVPVFV